MWRCTFQGHSIVPNAAFSSQPPASRNCIHLWCIGPFLYRRNGVQNSCFKFYQENLSPDQQCISPYSSGKFKCPCCSHCICFTVTLESRAWITKGIKAMAWSSMPETFWLWSWHRKGTREWWSRPFLCCLSPAWFQSTRWLEEWPKEVHWFVNLLKCWTLIAVSTGGSIDAP